MAKHSIYIADDHQMMIDGIKEMFLHDEQYEITGTYKNGKAALQAIQRKQPDILLTDIKMPELDGLELVRQVKNEFPGIKTLVLSMYNEPKIVEDISAVGADGYILKNTGKEELFQALETILSNEKFYNREVMNTLLNRMQRKNAPEHIASQLTFREKDVLKHLVEGKSSGKIAELLHISIHTVETHRKNIMRKTGTHNIVELVHFSYNNDLI